ncbi:MAG: hypothetical protein HZB26_25990 [Candidatus Hydrogenedentes bacterium]|nr:hypothetical protein [Candidatus Hydrogenedentota bacterium]
MSLVCLAALPGFWFVKWLFGYTAGVLNSPYYIEQMAGFGYAAAHISLCGISIMYGLARALAFHPCFDTEYRTWLARTPFSGRQPLPAGPAHLVWQDAVVIIALTAFGLVYSMSPYRIVVCMFAPYLFFHAGTLHVTDNKGASYVLYCGVPCMWYFSGHEILRWCIPTLLYLLAFIQLPRCLRFIAEYNAQPAEASPPAVSEVIRQTNEALGNRTTVRGTDAGENDLAISFWPYNRLAPIAAHDFPRIDAILIPIALTWWVASSLSFIPEDEFLLPKTSIAPWIASFVISLVLSLGRLLKYMSGCSSPINLFGRVATLRWIVPGFDRIVIAPLLALGSAVLATTVMAACGVSPAFLYTVPPGIALLLLLNLGPSLHVWRLTGAHRLVPGMASKAGIGTEI